MKTFILVWLAVMAVAAFFLFLGFAGGNALTPEMKQCTSCTPNQPMYSSTWKGKND